jgi:predicted  nucleic acid-binding Zn-ribbon protein
MTLDIMFEKLRSLQNTLSEKIQIEQTIQEIPKILTTHEELLMRLKKAWIDKTQEYEKARATAGEYRNLLFEAESTRERAEKNIGLSSETFNMREYEILDKERRDATEKEQIYRKDLQRQDRLLSDLNEELKKSTALIEQQEQELANRKMSIAEEVSTKQFQLTQLEEQERSITEGLDGELLFKFDRIIRHKMGKGIVAIKSGVCTGCHMILPAQFANRVHQGEEIVFCPYCSRILFYEESEQDVGPEEYFNDDEAGSLADLEDLDDEDDEEEEERVVNIDYEE